ncbi:MAG TPA: zf-TFIIB domain-containing protein [Pirellulaceae bacterium]|nr:zf-TFIIB domain-containing protein [Pirellulaceae bacterium]
MECPTCAAALERAEYEDVTVFRCGQCSGYLIHRRRMVVVKTSRDRSPTALQEEAAAEQRPDNKEQIRCPRCRVPRMRKERIQISDEGEFHLDTCQECDHVWFDGGELARWQIDHEQGAQGREEEQMRRRSQMRTPEQKAAAAQRIAQLPHSPNFLEGAPRDLFFWIVCGAMAIVSVVLWWGFNQPVWAGVVSFALALLLVWQLVSVMETQLSRWIAVALVAACEFVYVGLLAYWT